MITYADFSPGAVLGECPFAFTPEALAKWAKLFPDDAQCQPAMPPAMIAMVTMRAFMEIMQDRPLGNIHAAQKFQLSRLPQLGERLMTTLRCAEKEIKSGRRWISFESETVDGSRQLVFRSKMKTIWAA
jgi:hypothetical protein